MPACSASCAIPAERLPSHVISRPPRGALRVLRGSRRLRGGRLIGRTRWRRRHQHRATHPPFARIPLLLRGDTCRDHREMPDTRDKPAGCTFSSAPRKIPHRDHRTKRNSLDNAAYIARMLSIRMTGVPSDRPHERHCGSLAWSWGAGRSIGKPTRASDPPPSAEQSGFGSRAWV